MPGITLKGLSCPACGGSLEIEEGKPVLSCAFCKTGLYVEGDLSAPKFYTPNRFPKEKIQQTVRRWFRSFDKASDLTSKADIQNTFLVFIPFFRYRARMCGWVLGKQKRQSKNSTYYVDVEKKILRDYDWNTPACNTGEFGIRWVDFQGDEIRSFNLEEVQAQGMTFEPTGTRDEALAAARARLEEDALKTAKMDKISFQKFFYINQQISLVYYPLWVVRYVYRERTYQVVVDGTSNEVLYGRAPGNNLYRAAMLIFSMMLGNLILTSALRNIDVFFSSSSDSDSGQALIFIVIISLAIMLFGFARFRYGGEIRYELAVKRREALISSTPFFMSLGNLQILTNIVKQPEEQS